MAEVLKGQFPEAFASLIAEINKLKADLTALKTSFDGHVHGGVTAGAANTAAVAASPAHTSTTLSTARN